MTGPIYIPKGRAREYSHLALSTYFGCDHLCTYCYIWCKYKQRIKARPRKQDVMRLLPKQAAKLSGCRQRVLLSFACDPYQRLERQYHLTREALKTLHRFKVPFQVLTKAGPTATEDFSLYGPADAFAVTLTLLDDRWRTYEPNAASPAERIQALIGAKSYGIETWVSLEPVLDLQQTLQIIRETHQFVDLYKIGKLNHMEPPEPIDWRDFGWRAVELCESLGKPYYIKHDLAEHLEGVPFTNTDNRCAGWRDHETGPDQVGQD
jgi:DNA repair photolyase